MSLGIDGQLLPAPFLRVGSDFLRVWKRLSMYVCVWACRCGCVLFHCANDCCLSAQQLFFLSTILSCGVVHVSSPLPSSHTHIHACTPVVSCGSLCELSDLPAPSLIASLCSVQSTYFRYCSSYLRGFRIWRRLFERDFPLLMGNAFILDFDLDSEYEEGERHRPDHHMKRYKRRYRNIFLLKRLGRFNRTLLSIFF